MNITIYIKEIFWTMLVSALPVAELRVGIPVGIAHGLPPALAFFCAVLGNLLPVPFIVLLVRQVFAWLKKSRRLGPPIERLERRAHLKGSMVRRYRLWGLLVLVAIPLPGTGAWTGALVAALLDIRLRQALPTIAAGVVIAGLLVLWVSLGVISFLA